MSTDLLGDPLPEPLPANQQLTDVDQLQGHSILAVFDLPNGRYQADLVIVTESGCWLVMNAEVDGCGEDAASIAVVRHRGYTTNQRDLSDYVSANELLRAGVINTGEHARLRAMEQEREAAKNAETAARLRAQLARLELNAGAAS
jgi:hypothetical protein